MSYAVPLTNYESSCFLKVLFKAVIYDGAGVNSRKKTNSVFGNSGFFCRSHLHHRSHHMFTGKISILAIFPGEAVRL